jgi:hypothetical protein
MRILNPEGIVRPRLVEGGLAPRLSDINGKKIGIIDDGFADSARYLHGIEQILKERYPSCETHYWEKPILSRPSPDDLIAEVCASSDAVIVGIAA